MFIRGRAYRYRLVQNSIDYSGSTMKVAVDITRKSHLNLRERVKSTQNHIAKQAQANSKMLAWLFGRRNIASCSL